MNLYIHKRETIVEEFKTTDISEYIQITKEDIEFKWEETEGSWDGYKHKYFGFVPYYKGVKQSIYEYRMGKVKMIFSDLTAEDYSLRLYPKYFSYFGLTQTA